MWKKNPLQIKKADQCRKCRPEWQMNRAWLRYDAEKKIMFCDICTEAQLVSSFTSGCKSLKLENIVAHENPKGKKTGKLAFFPMVSTTLVFK